MSWIRRRARQLRGDMTLAEVCLWQELRRRGIGGRFRRQHPIGPYIADFACLAARVVVEVDGSSHDLPVRAARDLVRDDWLRREGWTVLRYNDEEILGALPEVLEHIESHLA